MALEILSQVDLKKYTSWKVGGAAEFFAMPASIDEVREALRHAEAKHLRVTVISGGSNILVPDEGLKGLVICLRKLRGLEAVVGEERLEIVAMAGETKSALMKLFIKHNLPPAIFLSGLPGDVGGGIVMNAGISEKMRPREFVEITDWVDVLVDDKLVRFSKDDLQWSYRHCKGWQPGVIVRVGMSWPLSDASEDVRSRAQNLNRSRMDRQPLELPSCGSVFVNPPGTSSGREIEACGLKGFQIGGAQVSEKHANFIVNIGGATANDIRNLIKHVQKTVHQQKGIDLHTEVVFL